VDSNLYSIKVINKQKYCLSIFYNNYHLKDFNYTPLKKIGVGTFGVVYKVNLFGKNVNFNIGQSC